MGFAYYPRDLQEIFSSLCDGRSVKASVVDRGSHRNGASRVSPRWMCAVGSPSSERAYSSRGCWNARFFFFFFSTCATTASVVAPPVQEATTSVVPTFSAAVVSLHCISLLVWELSFYVERDSQMLTVSGSFCVYIYRYI